MKVRYNFPWNANGAELLIGHPLFLDRDNFAYYAQFYSQFYIPSNKDIVGNYQYKVEMYRAKFLTKDSEVCIYFNKDSLLPISMPRGNLDNENSNDIFLELECNQDITYLRNFIQNRFHHMYFHKGDSIRLKSNKDLIVGESIPLNGNLHRKKMVLVIFIDAFSASLLKRASLEDIAPNTYNFFKKGVIFNNCFSNSEYTLTSLSSMNTGKYPHKNNFFHPRERQILTNNGKILSQRFQESGYFTQLISGNPGQNPDRGYCKGYDRVVYQNELSSKDIIYELSDSMRIFKNRDVFNWISLFDIHHELALIPGFSADASMKVSGHDYYSERAENPSIKTPFMKFSKNKTERYLAEIARLDHHMQTLYNSIEQDYSDKDFLVALVSDHGQSFCGNPEKSEPLLRQEKINVPMMLRGADGFSNIVTDEYIENVDLVPTLLSFSGIKFNDKEIDGVLPKSLGGNGKEGVFSESIYPGQTYKASIKDKKFHCFIESEKIVQDDGVIDLSSYNFWVEDVKSGNRVDDLTIYDLYLKKISTLLKKSNILIKV